MLQPSIAIEALLICLFTAYQQVSSFNNCKPSWNNNGWICEPEDLFDSTSWVLPVIIVVPIVVTLGCCITICFNCCKSRRTRGATGPTEDPTVMISTQPPVYIIPPMPSAPPENQCIEPPPYTEVAWKPYPYPPAMGQPPAYDNIAMDPPQNAYHPQR